MTSAETIKSIIDKAYEVKAKYDSELKYVGMFNPDKILGQYKHESSLKELFNPRKYYKRSLIVSERLSDILRKIVGANAPKGKRGFRHCAKDFTVKTAIITFPLLATYYLTKDFYLAVTAGAICGIARESIENILECTPTNIIEKPTERLERIAKLLEEKEKLK